MQVTSKKPDLAAELGDDQNSCTEVPDINDRFRLWITTDWSGYQTLPGKDVFKCDGSTVK